jgi:hypothetical protein
MEDLTLMKRLVAQATASPRWGELKDSPGIRDRMNLEAWNIHWADMEEVYLGLAKRGERVEDDRFLIAYLLGITDSFDENKLPPQIDDLPDIDSDFDMEGRAIVAEYLVETYGEDHVSYINNLNALKGGSVLRDVFKAYGLKPSKELSLAVSEAESVRKIMPQIDMEGLLRTDPRRAEALHVAARLEGNLRHPSVTAAGMIVSKEPIQDYAALYVSSGKDKHKAVVNDKRDVEKIGFVKFDVLGLANCSVMKSCVEAIEERGGTVPDLYNLPYEGETAEIMMEEFRRGHTRLIFQFGADPLRKLTMRMRPDSIEDLIAATALVRPGPDRDSYIAHKLGERELVYPHPAVEEALGTTYGVMVYQEQVMAMCRGIGSLSWAETEKVRKLASKKLHDHPDWEPLGEKFVANATQAGMNPTDAEALWAGMKKHSEYSFNRAHAAAYTVMSWANMYLQVFHPAEWILANMIHDFDGNRQDILSEAARLGIDIGTVDVNESELNWTYSVDATGHLKLLPGINSIDGVGANSAAAIVRARKEKGRFIGGEVFEVRKSKNRYEDRYALQHESMTTLFDEREQKEFLGNARHVIAKNVYEALSKAGAIPGIEGDPVMARVAAGLPVDVTEGRVIHELWGDVYPASVLEIETKAPKVVHGYLRSAKKDSYRGDYKYEVQSDVPVLLRGRQTIPSGAYLFVVDGGGFNNVYHAQPMDLADVHPMSSPADIPGFEHLRKLEGSHDKGVAFFAGGKKAGSSFVGMFLTPQPRQLWLDALPEEGPGYYVMVGYKKFDERLGRKTQHWKHMPLYRWIEKNRHKVIEPERTEVGEVARAV